MFLYPILNSDDKRGNMCILKYILVPLLKLFVKESISFDRIPAKGPVILVANHASYIDGPMIRYFASWYTGREPRGIQARDWLEKSILRKFIFVTLLGQIPTNGSTEKAFKALRAGEIILLFPEGTRSSDGTIQKTTHTGLGVLASQSNAAVIPIGIEGSYDWWPRQKILPTFKLRCMKVRVGKPMRFTGEKTKKNFLAFQTKVMNAVAKLAHTTCSH